MVKGYLALVLHAHLPFIRHPEHETFLEENWLFESITETYIPLVDMFERLVADKVDFRLTISLSPTLISMLRDELLIRRYLKHLDKLITLAKLEVERTRSDRRVNKLALMYLERFQEVRYVFSEKYNNDLISAFKKFRDLGKIEIITSCATHGYLPLMDLHKTAVRAQVAVAVDVYKKVFASDPKGIWLPECGYHPGHEDILKEFGVRYFFVDTHGILLGQPEPVYGVYSPYLCGSSLAVFGRDSESSTSVWSSKEGYPGDHNYREYYRDIGFDLDYSYIKPFISGCGSRINTGIKYHRVTGSSANKDIYDRKAALDTAAKHAKDFAVNRKKQIKHLARKMKRPPIVVSPYDAELFGHWWFEGPQWLELVLRGIHRARSTIKTITPSEYLDLYEDHPHITPSMSSWGLKGFSEVWLDNTNDWIYRHLHKAAELMTKAAEEYKNVTGLKKRILNQMARELLLAQSSDWAFIMRTGTFTDYATERTKDHIMRFLALHDQLRENRPDIEMLEEAEHKHNIFEDVDYGIYANKI